jgi:preprotein translocase SecE subunit
MNNQKYILMAFLAAAVLVGMSVRGLMIPLLASLEVADPLFGGAITGTTLAGLAFGAITFAVLNRHESALRFTDETITELRKVAWPDREETIRSSTIVVGTTLFIAVALASYDFVWAKLTSIFLFTEG